VLRVYNPTGTVRVAATTPRATRLDTLTNARLAVILNEPGSALATNWDGISRRLTERLRERFALRHVLREVKPLMSAVAPHDLIERVIEQTQAAINGLGK
jgi:hypothetical protein